MRTRQTIGLGTALGAAIALPVQAADLSVRLQLPEITTGRYENPYVSLFIEKDDDTFVRSLSLWHTTNPRRGGPGAGDRYLNSLRDWWRSSGTTSQMPIDGVSGATRGPGTHEVVFTNGKAPLGDLPAGKYQLVVEVAREIKGPRGGGGLRWWFRRRRPTAARRRRREQGCSRGTAYSVRMAGKEADDADRQRQDRNRCGQPDIEALSTVSK